MTTTVSPMDTAPLPPSEPITAPGTGIANLPNQRHKIVAKNGANFTLMVCGKSLFSEHLSLYIRFINNAPVRIDR